MLHAVIMAGGSGTRFWPASRNSRPKQLLDLAGERTMIQMTVDRLGDLTGFTETLVVTNQRLVKAIRQQLPELPSDGVIGEPCKRDTAPCVGLAAAILNARDQDATMVMLPADHVIRTDEQFRSALRFAADLVDEQATRLVTFGIPPTYPAEAFGYIEHGELLVTHVKSEASAYRVVRFREKPDRTTAEQFLAAGRFYWNSGIFVWKAKTILGALEHYEPEMFGHIRAIAGAVGRDDFANTLQREFAAIQAKSIDYAVMEHYHDVVVVQAPFTWDDMGSWQSLARLRGADEQGNTIVGRHLGIRTTGSIVRTTDDHLVVTLGMENCIVVHTPEATLVANKQDEEAVRKVVKLIEQNGWHEYL